MLRILNNGHTIQIDHRARSVLHVGDTPSELMQIHFHAPSEHTVSGKYYPLEIHFVHRQPGTSGNLAVIGVFVTEAASSQRLQSFWTKLPPHEGAERVFAEFSVNPAELLPSLHTHFEYARCSLGRGHNDGNGL